MPDGTRQAFAGNTITNPNPTGLEVSFRVAQMQLSQPDNCDACSDDLTLQLLCSRVSIRTIARKFDVRIDWVQSEKQRIFGRFSFDRLLPSTYNAFDNMWDLNYAQNVTNGRNVLSADDSR